MGSSPSVSNPNYSKVSCCGIKKSFDYDQALKIIQQQAKEYIKQLNKPTENHQSQEKQMILNKLNQTKAEAYELLKTNQEDKALLQLKNLYKRFSQKIRQQEVIDKQMQITKSKQEILEVKIRQTENLLEKIQKTIKPKKPSEQYHNIMQFEKQLSRIKLKLFQQKEMTQEEQVNYSQKAQVLIALTKEDINEIRQRIRQEKQDQIYNLPSFLKLQSKIELQKFQSLKLNTNASTISPIKKSAIKQPIFPSKQSRDLFLKQLDQSGKLNERTFRKLQFSEIQFFKKLQIQVGNTPGINHQSTMLKKSNFDDFGKASNSLLFKKSSDYDLKGFCYLNCQGYLNFDIQNFIKCDWAGIEVLDLQQCNITTVKWRMLTEAKARSLPNLKVLYLGMNPLSEVNESELQQLKGIEYLSFGWWDQSNQLSKQSKQIIFDYQSGHPQIKIQYTHY